MGKPTTEGYDREGRTGHAGDLRHLREACQDTAEREDSRGRNPYDNMGRCRQSRRRRLERSLLLQVLVRRDRVVDEDDPSEVIEDDLKKASGHPLRRPL